MKLVIVESPAKGKTIESFLGSGYKVLASFGHVRDLPKSKIGIDMENFEPQYVIPTKTRKIVTTLKKEAAAAEEVILATDEDREGEAIAWHLLAAIQIPEEKYKRITFHEITKEAILESLKNPRKINQNLVDAQQGRRVLDRLVGYNISPLLWKKIMRGLSAGRVQSVALRFIVEREREIEQFKSEEYWELTASLFIETNNKKTLIEAKLNKINDQPARIRNAAEARDIIKKICKEIFLVDKITVKDYQKKPPAPFVTSSLQQEAFKKLRFTSKKTMTLAQRLYEGKTIPGHGNIGLITYMRTDSTHLSSQSITEIRKYISDKIGAEYISKSPRQYKKVKGAQEAHEAIRPTSILRTPAEIKSYLEPDELTLYKLIWDRTVASQMKEEILELTRIDIKAGEYTFRTNGKRVKFDGFAKVYHNNAIRNKETILPKIEEGSECLLQELIPEQKFTQPPPRYTEATLIKVMEENGIGRPSTYAPTISTIKNRGYVKTENRFLVPEKIGFAVNDFLVNYFPEVFNVKFTAVMEKELDDIASGKLNWKEPIKELWHLIKKQIDQTNAIAKPVKLDEETNETCEKCGKPMVIKQGKYGSFLACSGFPECENTKRIIEKVALKCPKCGGDVITKKTKRGRIFYGCINYPKCDFATWKLPEKP